MRLNMAAADDQWSGQAANLTTFEPLRESQRREPEVLAQFEMRELVFSARSYMLINLGYWHV